MINGVKLTITHEAKFLDETPNTYFQKIRLRSV